MKAMSAIFMKVPKPGVVRRLFLATPVKPRRMRYIIRNMSILL